MKSYDQWLLEKKQALKEKEKEEKEEIENSEKKKKSETDDFDPPENLVQPAENDKGYQYVKSEFEKMKCQFQPRIKYIS